MKKVTFWKELTLREKIGQTVICLSEKDKHIQMCGSVQAFLEKYPIGGMFNNGGLVKGLLTGENLEFEGLLDEYNQYLRVPLIGTADRGAFAAQYGLQLLPRMALGAADNEELAYRAGEYMARDCRLSGVHWVFWPVCDLNLSAMSPIVNTRAVSDDPNLNARIVAAEVQAIKDNGVAATLKHYPGSPYVETIDCHLSPVDNETPMELWWDTYGKMYRKLIEQGAPSIMTSHINLVNYQTEKNDGVHPPATMSDELVNKLLRQELGYQGVTVTDALVMGGFCGAGSLENTVRSFLSGNDVMLWPAYEYIDVMEQKILSGEIINCMSNGNDMVYHCKDTNLMRSSGDFYPNRESSHSAHIFHNAVNSIWLSQFVWCDWDMFQTSHMYGPYHAAARAISGSPVYVSDRVDEHDFELIRALTGRDGKAMLALDVAMPTMDCLFTDPSEEKTLYKIFNRNALGSVVGVFSFGGRMQSITVSPSDVPGNGDGRYAIYSHKTGKMAVLRKNEAVEVSLEGMQWDIITISKIEKGIAVIGLTEKLNCGGAVQIVESGENGLHLQIADQGQLLIYTEKSGFQTICVPPSCEVMITC